MYGAITVLIELRRSLQYKTQQYIELNKMRGAMGYMEYEYNYRVRGMGKGLNVHRCIKFFQLSGSCREVYRCLGESQTITMMMMMFMMTIMVMLMIIKQ